MPKYRVVITELVSYELSVEADNEEAAGEKGQTLLNENAPIFEMADSLEVHNQEIHVEKLED